MFNLAAETHVDRSIDNPENLESPFYPLKESMEDLQYQINELKARVTEYESTLHAPNLNSEILKLIKVPHLQHEIIMNNGTIIQGTIIFENAEQMVVKTQIGQLTIEKEFVYEIREKEPIEPVLEFNPSVEIEESKAKPKQEEPKVATPKTELKKEELKKKKK